MLARILISTCGTLEEAAEACRVESTSLSDYQSVHGKHFMPADVIADLEAYCGEKIYSRALFEAGPDRDDVRDLISEGCEAAESATDLQRQIRLAAKDGKLTGAEISRLTRLHADATRELAEVGQVLDRHGGKS